jgi:hypothetical protein
MLQEERVDKGEYKQRKFLGLGNIQSKKHDVTMITIRHRH